MEDCTAIASGESRGDIRADAVLTDQQVFTVDLKGDSAIIPSNRVDGSPGSRSLDSTIKPTHPSVDNNGDTNIAVAAASENFAHVQSDRLDYIIAAQTGEELFKDELVDNHVGLLYNPHSATSANSLPCGEKYVRAASGPFAVMQPFHPPSSVHATRSGAPLKSNATMGTTRIPSPHPRSPQIMNPSYDWSSALGSLVENQQLSKAGDIFCCRWIGFSNARIVSHDAKRGSEFCAKHLQKAIMRLTAAQRLRVSKNNGFSAKTLTQEPRAQEGKKGAQIDEKQPQTTSTQLPVTIRSPDPNISDPLGMVSDETWQAAIAQVLMVYTGCCSHRTDLDAARITLDYFKAEPRSNDMQIMFMNFVCLRVAELNVTKKKETEKVIELF